MKHPYPDHLEHPYPKEVWLTNGRVAWAIRDRRMAAYYLQDWYDPPPGWQISEQRPPGVITPEIGHRTEVRLTPTLMILPTLFHDAALVSSERLKGDGCPK